MKVVEYDFSSKIKKNKLAFDSPAKILYSSKIHFYYSRNYNLNSNFAVNSPNID